MKLQRDIFLDEVYKKMKNDENLYVLSADFGAESLDKIRQEFKNNFIHCGISEQAMFDIATGLALEGKKVITYAMGPFISLRAIEQIKCGPAMMELPMNILSVGIGIGYADAGPTHYATEDYTCLRSISGVNIYTPSDNFITKETALSTLDNNKLNYIRLDRHITEDIKLNNEKFIFKNGFRIIGEKGENKIAIISHGRILHNCLNTLKKYPRDCFIVDLFNSKPISEDLAIVLSNSKKIIVVDEQVCNGNLSNSVQDFLSNRNILKLVKNLSLPEKYIFENGGRDYLLKTFSLDENGIQKFFEDNL